MQDTAVVSEVGVEELPESFVAKLQDTAVVSEVVVEELPADFVAKLQDTAIVAEVGVEELPEAFVAKLTALHGDAAQGRLLSGRYGVTSYELLEPTSALVAGAGSMILPCAGPQPLHHRKVAVLAHGLGTSREFAYGSEFRQVLLAAGYTLLLYNFYGHGWSYASATVAPPQRCCRCVRVEHGVEICLTQVRELLAHVLEPGEEVDLWVGHSLGGLIGVLAAEQKVWKINNMALISPAFWAVKGALTKVIEGLHPFSTMLTSSTCLLSLVEGEYEQNNDRAFARDGAAYLFPELHKQATVANKRKFQLYPQLSQAILGLTMGLLRGDLLPKHRAAWQSLMQGEEAPTVLLLWGELDVVVPFKHAQEPLAWNPERMHLCPLEGLGHESCCEAPARVAQAIVDFFATPMG